MVEPRQRKGELRWGWGIILAVLVGVGCGTPYLPFYTLGPILNPLTAEFDWSRAQVQTALLFSTSVGALVAPIIGWIIDRRSEKIVASWSLVGLAIAFALASLTTSLLTLYACYIAMAVLGAGAGPVTWTRIINARFTKNRGLALAATLSGTGLCAILAPMYVTHVVEMFGWRAAYVALAVPPLALALPLVLLFVRAPNNPVPDKRKAQDDWGLTPGAALRSYRFWVLAISVLCLYTVATGLVANLVPLVTDRGFTPAQAARIMGSLGLSIIVGRLVVGTLIDHLWAPGVAASVLWMPAAAALILLGEGASYQGLILAAAFIGFAAGAELDILAFLCVRYFGLKHYGKIYSILYAVLAVAGGFAPLGYAHTFDVTGNYDISLLISIPLTLVGAMILPLMGKYPAISTRDQAN